MKNLLGIQSNHDHVRYNGLNPVRRLSNCYCHKLTPGAGHQPGWFERLLTKLVPHFDIIKAVRCEDCYGCGLTHPFELLGIKGVFDETCSMCEGTGKVVVTYLRRFYLFRSKWIGKNFGDLYLHHIVRSDDDPDPHDHPWGFWGFVIAGGYTDQQWLWVTHGDIIFSSTEGTGRRIGPQNEVVKPRSFIKRAAEHIHRVILPEGKTAWTLIWTSGYSRDWNFITENGPVFWRTYLNIPSGVEVGE